MSDPLITVYSDASFWNKTGKSGWAAWMRNGPESQTISGIGDPWIDQAWKAEAEAVVRAVEYAAVRWSNASRVLVKTDCAGLTGWMNEPMSVTQYRKKKEPDNPKGAAKYRLMRRLYTALGGSNKQRPSVELEVRWTKSHQCGGEIPASLNRLVDDLAYRRRMEAEGTPVVEHELSCPECSGPMKLRRGGSNGRAGYFYGCRSFPNCRATVPADRTGTPRP